MVYALFMIGSKKVWRQCDFWQLYEA